MFVYILAAQNYGLSKAGKGQAWVRLELGLGFPVLVILLITVTK